MKLEKELVFTKLGDEYVAVPTGEAAERFHCIIRLNTTGTDVVHGLIDGRTEDEIAAKLVKDYEGVNLEHAKQAVASVVEKLRDVGLVED